MWRGQLWLIFQPLSGPSWSEDPTCRRRGPPLPRSQACKEMYLSQIQKRLYTLYEFWILPIIFEKLKMAFTEMEWNSDLNQPIGLIVPTVASMLAALCKLHAWMQNPKLLEAVNLESPQRKLAGIPLWLRWSTGSIQRVAWGEASGRRRWGQQWSRAW